MTNSNLWPTNGGTSAPRGVVSLGVDSVDMQ